MNADATALIGPVKPLVHGHRAEGSFVVHRDAYYYLFYAVGGCCDGVFSGYTVKVGRARSPLGPFLTQNGERLTELRSKGGIVASANGNRWVGPGHNAIQTDLAGQDWLVYHAIPESDPDFPPIEGARGGTLAALAKRPLLIDRLDWINGWPILRAGAGPSAGPQPAPVTTVLTGSRFNHGPPHGWKARSLSDSGDRREASGRARQNFRYFEAHSRYYATRNRVNLGRSPIAAVDSS